RQLGHKVVGVDSIEIAGVRDRVDDFFVGDLEDGIPEAAGGDYDVVIAADVIEHVRNPERLLRQMTEVLSPTGQIVISTPNFGHWYSRGRVAIGAFDYDRRGILDETHLRFFSRKSLRRTIGSSGLDLLQLEYTGLPLEVLTRTDSWKSRSARSVDRRLVQLRPTVFGYQFVARLRPHHAGSVTHYA
ncbi:MAG: hypothetical protein QOI26_2186, partial [Pseudonocardiales bacterium]|nr:hypothetical protein [Pseudonocardiales bacterium]